MRRCQQVYLDQLSQIDYELHKGQLMSLYKAFRPQIIVAEENTMGRPLIEALRSAYRLPIQPFHTSNVNKKEIVDGLSLAFEQGTLDMLNEPVQIGELLSFEQTKLPSGLFRYAAAGTGHDDTALALGQYAIEQQTALRTLGQKTGVWKRAG